MPECRVYAKAWRLRSPDKEATFQPVQSVLAGHGSVRVFLAP